MSDNEIYLLIKYIKSVLRRAAKRLSYTEDARCLKVNITVIYTISSSKQFVTTVEGEFQFWFRRHTKTRPSLKKSKLTTEIRI